jgi:hypothetical protein
MRATDVLTRALPLTQPLVTAVLTRQMDVAVALYAAISFAYVCSAGGNAAWAALAVPFLGLAAISTESRTVRFGAVLGISAVMAGLVAMTYYSAANHGFMLIWVGLGIAIACACEPPRDEVVLGRNAAVLLGILMAFALVQKLRAPHYMHGDLLGGLILQGDIYFNLISAWLPEWPGLVGDYQDSAARLMEEPRAASVAIAVPASIVALAWRMTVVSLLAQAVLELLILFRAQVGMLLHLAILGFVLVVYSTRPENEFLAINCLLGYAMTDEKTAAARPWYVVAVVYLLGSIMIGVRPWPFS